MRMFSNPITEQNDNNNPIQDVKKAKFPFINIISKVFINIDVKNKKTLAVLIPIISLVLLGAILFMVRHQTNTISNISVDENNQAKIVLNQLKDINAQLQELSAVNQNSTGFKEALSNIGSDLTAIQKSVNDLAKSSDVQKVSSQITSMQSDVDSQMLDLKRVVANSSKDYLDPKVLPFHVISIDVISQQPFITIDYDHHQTPLTIGDSMAGWQITSADYNAAQVEFKNDHNQYVRVNLQG